VLATLGTDVLGSPWDKLPLIAVLTSAAASTQTTILPTARTSLSMAYAGAAPKRFGNIHPRYLTPSTSTIWMGVLSIAWYVGLTIVSEDILFDSIAALGLMIAFYYGITGFACPIYYRRELFKSAKSAILVGLAPLLGGLILAWVFIKILHRPGQPGELRVGRLLVRSGAAAGHRRRLPAVRRGPHVPPAAGQPRVLPTQAPGGRSRRDRHLRPHGRPRRAGRDLRWPVR
jgi:amino acid transporter